MRVVPSAKEERIIQLGPQEIKVSLTAPPIKGKANKALIDLLKRITGKKVELIQGYNARKKVVIIHAHKEEEKDIWKKLGGT